MTSRMSVSEARATLPQLLDRVLAGEEITITRHGRPVAVVVRPDALRARRADRVLASAAGVQDVIDRGRRSPLPARPTVDQGKAEALLADVRASRSHR